jgi:hypothetical protein
MVVLTELESTKEEKGFDDFKLSYVPCVDSNLALLVRFQASAVKWMRTVF